MGLVIFKAVNADEVKQLKDELKNLGFKIRDISLGFLYGSQKAFEQHDQTQGYTALIIKTTLPYEIFKDIVK